MEVETEKQGRASAQDVLIETSFCGTRRSFVFVCQEAFGKVTDSANSLECQLASACATAERLKVPTWGGENLFEEPLRPISSELAPRYSDTGGGSSEALADEQEENRSKSSAALSLAQAEQAWAWRIWIRKVPALLRLCCKTNS